MLRFPRTSEGIRAVQQLTTTMLGAVSLAVGAPQLAGAQASAPEPLTLAGAVTLARANHPALPTASARGRAAVAAARQEAAFSNPVLELRRENLGSPIPRDEFTTIIQPLDLTGRRFALRAGARDLERRTLADSASVMRDVEANAARAFWRASLARALVAIAQEHRADAERLARFETERAREGAVAEASAMRARMEADRARIAESSAAAALTQAIADLSRATGVPADSLPPVSALVARIPAIEPAPSVDAAVERALASRSELTALRAADAAAGHRYSAEQRAVFPDVVVQAGAKQTAGYSTRVLGVAVPLPLFNQNRAARDRATAELQLVRTELRAAEQSIRTSVAAMIETYDALRAAQPGDSTTVRAIEVAAIADAAYVAGGSSLLELIDARRARAETLAAVLRWVADLRVVQTDLARALGASPLDPLILP
jgi:outer membrane protein, heavy metal efflux system